LVAQIVGKEVGPRHRGDIGAGTLELTEGKVMGLLSGTLLSRRGQAQRRIVEQARRGSVGWGERPIANIGSDRRFECGDRRLEAALELVENFLDTGGGIGGFRGLR